MLTPAGVSFTVVCVQVIWRYLGVTTEWFHTFLFADCREKIKFGMEKIKEQIESLKALDLEARAKTPRKECPSIILLLIAGCGLVLGLLYWFYDEIIFSYYSISPFWGFIIYLLLGLVLSGICAFIYLVFWDEYNTIIDQAEIEYRRQLEKEINDSEELYNKRIEWIENHIGTDYLTQKLYEWHTKEICWGCGKKHTTTPIPWHVHEEKIKTSKKDALTREVKRYYDTAVVYLCPECYERISKAEEWNRKVMGVLRTILYYGPPIGVFIYCIIESILASEWIGIPLGLLFAVLTFGLLVTVGHFVLLIIAGILALPFLDNKEFNNKWNFRDIPDLRKIRNK